jgi:hypothetical protein
LFERVLQALRQGCDFGLCTGASVSMPPVGARVRVVGPYVLDHPHGWMEIHLVWRLETLSRPAGK